MRQIVLGLAMLGGSLLALPAAAGTRTVDGSTTGKYHNDVWNSWSEVPVIVYVDDTGNAYISGRTDGGIIKARGFLTVSDVNKVASLLRKSQEWVRTAKAEGLEVTKELGSFMQESEFREYGVALRFFSANAGKQTDVIITLVDFENQFFTMELYLEPNQVAGLIRLLEKVPATVAELKKQEAAAAKLR